MVLNYGEAIREALHDELKSNPNTILLGEDIRYNLYGYTGGLVDTFGKDRVVDVPLSESGVVGTAIGAAMCGMKVIVDLTVANFLFMAMDQIVSMASKTAYMYDGQLRLPITIMTSTLYNASNAAQHSDRPHSIFMNIPGLKIAVPALPQDAYGLLRSAVNDNSPVLYFSDRTCFYLKEEVDINERVEIGKARLIKKGTDITIVTISGATKLAMEILPALESENISAEVIDVRSVAPLDMETILTSVKKTGRVLIADTANKSCSAASEISSVLAEKLFDSLVAPIAIVAHADIPVPFARHLEQYILPTKEKIFDKAVATVKYSKSIEILSH